MGLADSKSALVSRDGSCADTLTSVLCLRGVLDDTSLGLVLYYQYSNIDVGIANVDFMFGWNVLSWSNGWPVV